MDNVFSIGDHYDIKIDYASSTVTYYGYSSPGSATSSDVFLIKKETKDSSGRTTDVQYAGNKASFTNIWDDRASLQYGP